MEKRSLNRNVILLMMLIISFSAFAQRDREFWFAVPTISQFSQLNQPDSLRITAYGQAAHVTLSIPANAGSTFNAAYGPGHPLTIPARTTVSIDLTPYLSELESRPPDVVTSTGMHIISDQEVSVYYELANYENGNFWPLKGKNAIGSSFYIPGQTFMDNVPYWNTNFNTINIIATGGGDPITNLTTVNITPSNDVVNTAGGSHPAGTTYTVALGLGQVITAQDLSTLAAMKLAGSKVTSDYPIAITESDDYMNTNGYWDNGILAYDAGGDQIIPRDKIGTSYIAIRGGLTVNPEKIFVLTTAPNTNIYQDGVLVTGTPMPVPSAGTTVQLDLLQTNVSSYITADKPVYVSQVSGMKSEAGWNQLPPITNCGGSTSVAYYRTFANSDNGVLLLLATNGGQNSFQYYLNGILQPNPLPAAPTWSAVPGAPAGWKATQIDVSAGVNFGDAIIITNSTPFIMGVVTGAYDVGSSQNATGLFGYFSDFGGIDIPPVANIPCLGDTLYLTADSLIGGIYSWSGPGGFTSTAQNTFIYPFPTADIGEYYLTVSSGVVGCTSFDSVAVGVNITCCPIPHIVLNGPDSLCSGGTITLTDTIAGATSLWSTGATTPSITVNASGTYWLRTTIGSCVGSDTVRIVFISAPAPFDLGSDTAYCGSFIRTLSTANSGTIWSTGVTASSISVSAPGLYWAIDSNICGSTRDSIIISAATLPGISIGDDTTLCDGSIIVLNAATDSASYLWQNGTTDSTFTVSTGGLYSVTVSVNGCSAADSILISYVAPPVAFDLGRDTTICGDSSIVLNAYQVNTNYFWNDGDTTSSVTVTQSGSYVVIDSNRCGSYTDSLYVTVQECACKIVVPNAFSPNSDEKNDSFYVLALCPLRDFQFNIYNRWGQKIFTTDNVLFKWDGTYKAARQPSDVYVYFMMYTDPYTNIEYSRTGNITLIR